MMLTTLDAGKPQPLSLPPFPQNLPLLLDQFQQAHGTLGRPPIAVWREHEGEIPLRLAQDRMHFWLTFLPEQELTLQPTGIHVFGMRYWSAALSGDVGRTNSRLLVKYDRRDMSRVFVRRPSGNFVEARYADLTLASGWSTPSRTTC